MRILYVSNDSEIAGGAALSLIDVISHMVEQMYVCVVVPKEGGLSRKLRNEGVNVFTIPFEVDFIKKDSIDGSNRTDRIIVSNYEAAVKIAEIAIKREIDIIHTNSSTGNAGAIAALLSGITHVWHIREMLEEHYEANYCLASLKTQLFNYSSIITISDFVDKWFRSKYGINSFRIYNGFSRENYCDSVDSNDKKHEFILAGNIYLAKGQWDAIEAFKLLKDEGYKNIHLNLLGSGDKRVIWEMKRYITERELQNFVTLNDFSSDIRTIRKKCECSLTTSKMEAFGRVTVEAMFSRQFVIGADSGGTTELIGNNERGLLYEQGSALSLKNKIKEYLNLDKFERDAIIDKAFEYASIRFGIQSCINQLNEVYKREIKRKKDRNNISRLKEMIYEQYYKSNARLNRDYYVNNKAIAIEAAWDRLNNSGRNMASMLSENGVKKVGIYGMGFFGIRLYEELEKTDIKISFVTDRFKGHLDEICNYRPLDKTCEVDAIIIAVSSGEDSIRDMIRRETDCASISLSELLNIGVQQC